MRLKKLTINNIASIERAVIDFSDNPLSDERLFLITGETGSGKSTIIDCLCLVLYGSTPRLKGTGGQVNYENAQDRNIGIYDPKQLLRRGCTDADIELTFEDKNNVPYIATWSVHRANHKVGGAIQDAVRTLRTEDGFLPAVNKKGKKEVNSLVEELIGLDAEQFFRTVVLAQGKFAEFLNSSEKEKSDLLEKMTGTEIYSQVGKRIYKVMQDKVTRCAILRGQMENIILLDDNQKAKINEEIAQHSREYEVIDEQLKKANAMKQWLTDKGGIEEKLAQKKEQLESDQEKTATPAHREQQQLVADWEATVDVRHQLKENQSAQARITELQGRLPDIQKEYDELCSALRAADADINKKQKKADEMGENIAREESNKAMYEAIGQIVTLFGQWGDKKKNITDYSADLEKDKQRLPDALKAVEDAKAKAGEIEQSVKELKKQQEAFNIPDISSRIDDLNRAYRALEILKDKHAAVAQTEASINDLKRKQGEEKTRLEEIKATVGEKRVRREEIQLQVDRVDDWNKLLKHAQNTLHEGDTCPVCGNTITTLLAPKAESELEEIRTLFKQADNALQQTLTQVQAAEKLILDYENRITEAGKELLKKQNERAEHWNVTVDVLEKCEKKADEMADNATIDTLIREIDGQVVGLNAELKKASDLSRTIQTAQQQLDEANRTRHKAEMQYNTLQESIRHQGEVIENCKKEVAELTSQLDELLVMKDWQEHAGEEFIKQLQAAADGYRELVTSRQQLSQLIDLRRAAIPAMLKTKESIKGLEDHGSTADQAPDDLEERWRGFGNKHVQWSTQLDNAKENAASTKQALDEYCNSHPEMNMERLKALNGHDQKEVNSIKNDHKTLNDAILGMKAAIATLTTQQSELNGKKPHFNEENPERLEEIIVEKNGVLERLKTSIAELRVQLSVDEENAKRLGGRQKELDEAEAEAQKWRDFNDVLGGSDGAKFRGIAQSYILGELLASANEYLKHFNNRYELIAKPASLLILARDLIQGDLTSVNTLSGGESFMVSLALALALSSMSGKMFSVDTLFIDEGFGSLSPVYLDNVMDTLNGLYEMGGRRVGIISHVEMLKERVPTQIQVYRDPDNNTVSRVKVV